jgi:hypothetical protein
MGGPGDEGDVDVGTPERLRGEQPTKAGADHHHLMSTLHAINSSCGPIHTGKRTAGPAVGAALAAAGPPLYRRVNTDARALSPTALTPRMSQTTRAVPRS